MAKKKAAEISVMEINEEVTEFYLLGKSPYLCHSMGSKLRRELTVPSKTKTRAEKNSSLKHRPYEEFRRTPYLLSDDNAPSLIAHLATAAKKAIAQVAVDVPGSSKAQLSRLLWVEGEQLPLYGVPMMHASVIRLGGIDKTPDIRFRVILPQWATKITVRYVTPILNHVIVSKMLAAAGVINGLGDWRPQKGGNYGQFEIVMEDDPRYVEVVKSGGRAAQREAMSNPELYDDETRELLSECLKEAQDRGLESLVEDLTTPVDVLKERLS